MVRILPIQAFLRPDSDGKQLADRHGWICAEDDTAPTEGRRTTRNTDRDDDGPDSPCGDSPRLARLRCRRRARDHRVHGAEHEHPRRREQRVLGLDRTPQPLPPQRRRRRLVPHRLGLEPDQVAVPRCHPAARRFPRRLRIRQGPGHRRSELHTNFSLDSDGEFLALVKPNGVTIAQSFSPYFPPQQPDVSYGMPQAMYDPVSFGDTMSYLVPTVADAALGLAWTATAFDDNGVGQRTIRPRLRHGQFTRI